MNSASSQRQCTARPPLRRVIAFVALAAAPLAVSSCEAFKAPVEVAAFDNAGLSKDARRLLEDFMDNVQLRSYKASTTDWKKLRVEVADIAKGSQHVEELNSAFQHVFTVLDDHHSRYVSRLGTQVRLPTVGCAASAFATPVIPPDLGYVRVQSFSGAGEHATALADLLQDSLRMQDKDGVVGWIIDLRNNGGGNMWPMVAGIGPLLGATRFGYFRVSTGEDQPWDYINGVVSSNGTTIVKATRPYSMRDGNARVAVLINRLTASSGEATAIAFKNRPNTRFFGTESCGLATAIQGFKLADNSDLFLAVSLMADRAKVTYPVTVRPDEQSASDPDALQRAIGWLRQ